MKEREKSTNQTQNPTRTGSSHDPIKASNYFAMPETVSDFFILFLRTGLLICLLVSILLALHSNFSTRSRYFSLPKLNQTTSNFSAESYGPTNISHILFGIGASVKTWNERRHYSEQWWDPNRTRGFVWFDKEPDRNIVTLPYRVSEDWTRFKYSTSQSAVRIARIVLESFKLGVPKVRWFVMGDDDTVFFTENLVSVLGRYDHDQMVYIGGNSESVEQNIMHSYDMAFGGGGFAVSYPLAALLLEVLDGCIDRYYYFYGSDQRIWACVSELGAPLTLHRGFHQFDIRGDAYGILAAHPMAPLVSLHHLDYLEPMFPNYTRIDSLKSLIKAYQIDPARIIQQSFCYDHTQKWSISIAWGYSVQLYLSMIPANDLQTPLQTFKTWRSWSNGPFTFNTRPVSSDPCKHPILYFLNEVLEVGKSGTVTTYERYVDKEGKRCERADYVHAMSVQRFIVSSLKMDTEYWEKVPRRLCSEIMDRGGIKSGSIKIRIRKCRPTETITA